MSDGLGEDWNVPVKLNLSCRNAEGEDAVRVEADRRKLELSSLLADALGNSKVGLERAR